MIDAHLKYLTSNRNRLRRQVAAAGLVRCRNLVEAMLILRKAGREDVLGILNRAVQEAWLVSLWVLLKGKDLDDDDVLVELGSDYAVWYGTMASKLPDFAEEAKSKIIEWKEIVADRLEAAGQKPVLSKLRYDKIAEELGPLLEHEGAKIVAIDVYNRAYRAESTTSVHAGLGTISRYLRYGDEEKGENDSVVPEPGSAFPDQEWLAALLTIDLADHVFRAFGVRVEPPLIDVYGRLKEQTEQA